VLWSARHVCRMLTQYACLLLVRLCEVGTHGIFCATAQLDGSDISGLLLPDQEIG
jgi:hypothetical protein